MLSKVYLLFAQRKKYPILVEEVYYHPIEVKDPRLDPIPDPSVFGSLIPIFEPRFAPQPEFRHI
jgi:hypothetical protein